MMPNCPCGSSKPFTACCHPYIEAGEKAATPEALMRSRYCAYTRMNMDYIQKTMRGLAAANFILKEALDWAKQVKWLSLTIMNVSPIEKNRGFVEFKIQYLFNGKKEWLHEISEFQFDDQQWFYVDGKSGSPHTPAKKLERVGRNERCPCGSSKKYKKCCGMGKGGKYLFDRSKINIKRKMPTEGNTF